MENKKFLVIDANSVIHRAFHALPPLTTKKGDLVNAVYGFILVFFRALKEFRPDYAAACFDFPAPTFRHREFKGYKAKRPPAPKGLYEQIPKVKEVLRGFNVSVFEKEGYEADDIIGTLAKKAEQFSIKENLETVIMTGDRDALQLIDKNTKVELLKRGVKEIILYDEDLFKEKYQGLMPGQLVDFKALKGDPSDNIPGVRGIGDKTAIKLIKEFGTLEELYSALAAVNPLIRAKLAEYKEQAFLSYHLAEIKKDVPVDFALEKCRWGGYDEKEAAGRLESLDFHSLVKKLPELRQKKEAKAVNGILKLW